MKQAASNTCTRSRRQELRTGLACDGIYSADLIPDEPLLKRRTPNDVLKPDPPTCRITLEDLSNNIQVLVVAYSDLNNGSFPQGCTSQQVLAELPLQARHLVDEMTGSDGLGTPDHQRY